MDKFDYYSLKPRFLFNKNYGHPTPVGGIITLIILVLTILTLSSFSQNFLFKLNPMVISKESNYKEPPVFNMTSEEFPMGVYFLSNLTTYLYEPSIFQIKAFIAEVSLNEKQEIVEKQYELELELCGNEHFPDDKNLKKSYESLGINLSLCFKKGQKIVPKIAGLWGQDRFSRLMFKYMRCINSTESPIICKPKEKIEEVISTGFIGVNIVDTLLDLEDFENPIKRIFNTPYTHTSTEIYKDYSIYIRKGIVRTDKGWITPIIEEKTFYSIAQEKEMVVTMKESELFQKNTFATINLRVNTLQQIFERKYEKIQNVLSNVGGMLKLLLEIGAIFIFRWVTLDYKEKFVNSIYNFHDVRKSNSGKADDKLKETELKRGGVKLLTEIGPKKFENGSKFKKVEHYFKVETNSIKLSLFDRIKNSIFCWKTTNRRIKKIDYAMEKIEKKLDLIYIVNKFLELDKLKMLLLDDSQLQLLEFIPRPKISEKREKGSQNEAVKEVETEFHSKWDLLYEMESDQLTKAKKAKEAFFNLMSRANKSEIDRKLIFMIDAKIQGLFKESMYAQCSNFDLIKEEEDKLENQPNKPLAITINTSKF